MSLVLFPYSTTKNFFKKSFFWLRNLKLVFYKKKISAHSLPHFLVFGEKNSGKTSFLWNSDLNLIEDQPFAIPPHREMQDKKEPNWWVSSEGIFLDLPGEIVESNNEKELNLLIDLLNKKKIFTALLFFIDIAAWTVQSPEEKQARLKKFNFFLSTFTAGLRRRAPFFLIFSKSDKISGFKEFFENESVETRDKSWGFSLEIGQNISKTCNEKFDYICQELHEKMLWQLHQQPDLKKRCFIYQFPLQLSLLKPDFLLLTYEISLLLGNNTYLAGIYFTSTLQEESIINLANNNIQRFFKSPKFLIEHNSIPQKNRAEKKSYFAKALINKVSEIGAGLKKEQDEKNNFFFYLIIASMVLFISSYLTNNYKNILLLLNGAQSEIIEYNLLAKSTPLDSDSSPTILPLLIHLQKANLFINQAYSTGFLFLGQHKLSIQTAAKRAYKKSLNRYFLPMLVHSLENTLVQSSNPEKLYPLLKAYLMLSYPENYNHTFLIKTLKSYWQLNDPRNASLLLLLLNDFLTNQPPSIIPNMAIVTHARSIIFNTNAQQLALIMLKADSSNALVNPFLDSNSPNNSSLSIFGKSLENSKLPEIYTENAFPTIYGKTIPQISKEIIQGDWVLGKGSHYALTESALSQIIRIMYLQDYLQHWQILSLNLKIRHFTNFQLLQNFFKSAPSENLGFKAILKTIINNTDVDTLTKNLPGKTQLDQVLIDTTLSHNFQSFNELVRPFGETAQTRLSLLFPYLNNLQTYLAPIFSAQNPQEAFFNLTKNQFSQISNKDPLTVLLDAQANFPPPLNQWIQQVVDNVETLMLNESLKYINYAWQKDVLLTYETDVNYHYPFFKDSKISISLESFTHFFGPEGVLTLFFNYYLAPFVDSTTPTWELRTINNQTLPMASGLLLQFERGYIIKHMFFNDQKKLNVNFSLIPIALAPTVKTFSLKYNENTYIISAASPKFLSVRLHWPPTSNPITIKFINKNNSVSQEILDGPWSLFQIFQKATLVPEGFDNREFMSTIDLDGNAIQYQILTDKPINPFISNIVEHFRCSPNL